MESFLRDGKLRKVPLNFPHSVYPVSFHESHMPNEGSGVGLVKGDDIK